MARTITKVGNLEEDLFETIRKYSLEFERAPSILGNTDKAAIVGRLENEVYLLMISKSKYGVHPKFGYNLILTLTSDSERILEELPKKFQEKTGMKLREAPQVLCDFYQYFNLIFNVFKEKPEAMMDFLRKIDQISRIIEM